VTDPEDDKVRARARLRAAVYRVLSSPPYELTERAAEQAQKDENARLRERVAELERDLGRACRCPSAERATNGKGAPP